MKTHRNAKITSAIIPLLVTVASLSARAAPLLTLDSQYLGEGLFEYRLAFAGQPYLERNGLTYFHLVFSGFEGVGQEPVDWKKSRGFPSPPQAEASLSWVKDDATREDLPYTCAFQVRSQKSTFRLGTAQVNYLLHWNEWAQPSNLSGNVNGSATLTCLLPCDPEQSDGSAPLCHSTASDFPQAAIQTISFQTPNPLRLGIIARAGLPLCIEATVDLKSWHQQ